MLLFNDLEIGKSYIYASEMNPQIRLFKVVNKFDDPDLRVVIQYTMRSYFSKVKGERLRFSKDRDYLTKTEWETPDTIFVKHKSLKEDGTLQKHYLTKLIFQYI